MIYTVKGFLKVDKCSTHHETWVYRISPSFCQVDKEELGGVALNFDMPTDYLLPDD